MSEDQDNTTADAAVSTRKRARRAQREPRQHELEARALTARVWEALDPKPATPFVAVSQIAESLLAAGWTADPIVDAMCAVPTISTRWVEAHLRKQGPQRAATSAKIDTARDNPGGRIQL